MKNLTGLYKHQRDNQGTRKDLRSHNKDYILVPIVKYDYEIKREKLKCGYPLCSCADSGPCELRGK